MNQSVSIKDVADLFLTDRPITLKKLNYLCYYAQAYHLAFLDRALFPEDFEAWIHGPVAPILFDTYKDRYSWYDYIPKKNSINNKFEQDSMWVLETVRDAFINETVYDLERLTTLETPWKQARVGYDRTEPCKEIISHESLREYYIQHAERELICPICNESLQGFISGQNEAGAIVNKCPSCKTDFIKTTKGETFIKFKEEL